LNFTKKNTKIRSCLVSDVYGKFDYYGIDKLQATSKHNFSFLHQVRIRKESRFTAWNLETVAG
jgi:hypothetical protein